jgi:Fic family protein
MDGRRSQNWIGPAGCMLKEATFVPPPVEEMHSSLSDWEKYLNSEQSEPILIQTALMHYQFEAIHPFIDGNGRIGRLLITLFLCQHKSLSQPLLYLSEFFDKYRSDYYDRLLAVSRDGDWQGWIEFFLRGVIAMASDALENAQKILNLYEKFSQRISQGRKRSDIDRRLIDEIFVSPVISNALLSKKWGLPFNSVKGGILKLEKMGILTEVSGKRRNKLYASKELLDILIK